MFLILMQCLYSNIGLLVSPFSLHQKSLKLVDEEGFKAFLCYFKQPKQ